MIIVCDFVYIYGWTYHLSLLSVCWGTLNVSLSLSVTVFLLSKALQDRDDQIRRMREEAAQAHKRLQQQLEEERAQQAEVRERLEHLSLRKEELKQQLEDKDMELEEVKRVHRHVPHHKYKDMQMGNTNVGFLSASMWAKPMLLVGIFMLSLMCTIYFHALFHFHKSLFSCFLLLSILCISDASKKWQEKADLLTRLESQVKRMKENFDAKECSLLEERQKAMEAHKYDTKWY